jgi:hypothetical protein
VVETAGNAAASLTSGLFDLGKKAYKTCVLVVVLCACACVYVTAIVDSYWAGAGESAAPEPGISGGGGGGGGGAGDASAQNAAALEARAGAVKVFDVVRLRTLAFFRAHWQPLAVLAFDARCVAVLVCEGASERCTLRSGTMLITAAVDGQTFNVYSLRAAPPAASDAEGAPTTSQLTPTRGLEQLHARQLYRLVRGFTSAVIQV